MSKRPKIKDPHMSAHAKIMQARRTRDRWITAVVSGIVLLGLVSVILFFATRGNNLEDYSVIGSGDPVIVQVHQLNCTDCDILRANAKRALKQIDNERLKYRMAYLHKAEGIAFASQHGAARFSTLVLFDRFGRKKGIYSGVQDTEQLVELFESLL
ncbi:MAG: hypothetical protein ACPG42_11805 [Alphaproteobacteria bacterium]|jgi:hypothetical protein